MSSVKFTFENSDERTIEDLINDMKNEMLQGAKAKAQVYSFDFENERPMSGTQIFWFEDYQTVQS